MRKKVAFALAMLMMLLCLSGCGGEKKEQEYFTSPDQLNDSRYSIGVGMGTADVYAVEENLPKAEMIDTPPWKTVTLPCGRGCWMPSLTAGIPCSMRWQAAA